MEDPDQSQGHFFANEVDVNINVLCVSMMYRVGGLVDHTDIVAIDKCL